MVTGNEQTSGKPLTIMCAVNHSIPDMIYMCNLVFGGSFQKVSECRAWLWDISRKIAAVKQDCSLVIVQVRKLYCKLIRSNHWIYIPEWVNGEVDIPNHPEATKSSSLKSDIRRIRKNSLRFEVTHDPKQFDDFYYNMYLPHITKTHANSAVIVTYEHMRRKFNICELLLVLKNENHIAGILIIYEKTGPCLWSLDIRDSNPEYIKSGAVRALFYFSLLHLKDKGFKHVNFGTSRAFTRDGVLRYKKKWLQKIVGTSANWFALKLLSRSEAVNCFLQQNPFIFDSNGALNCAVFVDGDFTLTLEYIKKIDKQYFYPGLAKLIIYRLGHGDTVGQDNVPPELSNRIVIRSAGDMP